MRRRGSAQCQDHLHNVGIALHNYEGAHKFFPNGNVASSVGGWGASWWIRILPFSEQNALYSRLTFNGAHHGWTLSSAAGDPAGDANGNALNGVVLDFSFCPSSPMEPLRDAGGGRRIMNPSYFGIMGATDGNGFTNPPSRVANCCGCCGGQQGNGQIVDGGLFGPLVAVAMREVIDGMSNTIVVGEHSNFIRDGSGRQIVQVSGTHGILMGSPNLTRIRDCAGCMFDRQFNLTTVRFAPNAPAIDNHASWPGVGDNFGVNNPLNSAHPGGIQVLMGDDVVKFASENIDMQTFRRAVSRADGQPTGTW